MEEIERKLLEIQQEREKEINNKYNVIFYNGKYDNNDDRIFIREETRRHCISMYGNVKKTCNQCKELKYLYEFPTNQHRIDGHLDKCLKCQPW
ncbi:MAG: hypothetical protein V3V33_16625 [Candidatus Lokiarchaeia archaeon]